MRHLLKILEWRGRCPEGGWCHQESWPGDFCPHRTGPCCPRFICQSPFRGLRREIGGNIRTIEGAALHTCCHAHYVCRQSCNLQRSGSKVRLGHDLYVGNGTGTDLRRIGTIQQDSGANFHEWMLSASCIQQTIRVLMYSHDESAGASPEEFGCMVVLVVVTLVVVMASVFLAVQQQTCSRTERNRIDPGCSHTKPFLATALN